MKMKKTFFEIVASILPHETWGFKSNLPTLKSVMNCQELARLLASTEVLGEQRCDAAP